MVLHIENLSQGEPNESAQKALKRNWSIDDGLEGIRVTLDELADSIGGICVLTCTPDGQRKLTVQKKTDSGRSDLQQVKDTVERMRQLVHVRHRVGESQSHALATNHNRRHIEKKKSKEKQAQSDIRLCRKRGGANYKTK